MRCILVMACLALTLVTCSGPGFDATELKKFPSYSEVYEKAFATHSKNLNGKGYLQLARKTDGWYLVEMDAEGQEKKLHPFWTLSDNQYLPFPKEIDVPQPEYAPRETPREGDLAMFRVIPFYGYRDWYKDVIANFENATLSDTLTEALARAYETRGAVQSGMSYGLDGKGVSQMTDEQENALIENTNKALELYKALYAKNPAYNTVVGNAQNKYSNQCMAAYGSLKYFGHADKAKAYLKEDLYTPFIINFAKNMLTSCDKNGILITYGDNDYFPLMYVQHKLGWRTDVALLNINLMMVDTYIDKFISANQLKHQLDAKAYANEKLNFIVVSPTQGEMKMGTVLDDFSKGKWTPYLRDMGEGRSYCILDGSSLLFDNVAVSPAYSIKLSQGYVYKNDLCLWDLLYSNGRERPVFLTGMGNWKPYLPNLSNRGMVLAFTYEPADSVMRTDTAFMYNALLYKFRYDLPNEPSLTERMTANNYVYQFYELANAYKTAGNKLKAVSIIQKCLEIFPQKTMQPGYTYFVMARLLEECGDVVGAIQMGNDYADGLEKGLKTAKGRDRQDMLRNLQGTTTMLMAASENWAPVRKKLENLMTAYMKEISGASGMPVQ